MTTLSDRLAAAADTLEDAATDLNLPALRAAARAWTRVADEVDGVAPHTITEAERATMRAALNATASDRDEWKDRAQDAASGVRLLRATLREIGECAEQLPDEPTSDSVRRIKARAEAAEIAARDLRAQLEAAERRLAEASRPATASEDDLSRIDTEASMAHGFVAGQTDGPGNVITDLDGPIVVPASVLADDGEPTPALVELMRKPAQTCPQCDADEIHCAGCGTNASRAWECSDCAAGGDAGREADRLRDAVVEAARDWNDAATDAAENECANLSEAVDAFERHKAPAQVAQPTPVEPAKGERFVVMARKDVPVGARYDGVTTADHASRVLAFVEKNPDVPARQWMTMTEDARAGFGEVYPLAIVDTAPAPSDVARLAAALAARMDVPAWVNADHMSDDDEARIILRHLAGPLPGAGQAEALAVAYWKAAGVSAPMVGTADGFVDCLRRALLAVGAPAIDATALRWALVSVEDGDPLNQESRDRIAAELRRILKSAGGAS